MPGFAPSVPAFSGALPEFRLIIILRKTNTKVKAFVMLLYIGEQFNQNIDGVLQFNGL